MTPRWCVTRDASGRWWSFPLPGGPSGWRLTRVHDTHHQAITTATRAAKLARWC